MIRRAKIVATLGPVSSDPKTLARLLKAGLDVVRLNFSHGDHDQHRQTIATVRAVSHELRKHVPIVVDLMGPRYRLGTIDPVHTLRRNAIVTLGTERSKPDLPIESREILAHLKAGERILIDNGLVELRVLERGRGQVTTRVITGGPVSTRKGINLPDTELPFTVSAKDRSDIELAVQEKVDYVAASYVGRARDVEAIRREIEAAGGQLPIVAKLERGRAVEHLEEIARVSDAIMVARGDLGVEVPLYQVPVLQKRIVNAGSRAGIPVIVATQMLESMMEHPRPTRAESSDVANAIFDGADAVMLSGETAAGKYPVESVKTMDRIVKEAESYIREKPASDDVSLLQASPTTPARRGRPRRFGGQVVDSDTPDVVAAAAVLASRRLRAKQIIAFSQGGFTAKLISHYRPETPILTFTHDVRVARRSQLIWGVRPIVMDSEVRHHDDVVNVVDRYLVEAGLAKRGDTLVILMGEPIEKRPFTNLMRIHVL